MARFTYLDSSGDTRIRSWALPLAVAVLVVPILLAMLLGVVAIEGTGVGLAAGGLAVATLLVIAARSLPHRPMNVAARRDAHRRLLVLALAEPTPAAAERVAREAGDAADVRLVVPLASRRIDRWLSAEDAARDEAQGRLARTAGSLVAAGLPVSGSLGDSDPAQALEDELQAYPADEVLVLTDARGEDPLGDACSRVALPLQRVVV